MIRTVALLGLVASCLANDPWLPGLSCKFDINPFTWRKSSFFDLPRNSTAANEKGWTKVTRPTKSSSSGYDELELWVNPDDPIISILVDENGQTAGLQIAIPNIGLTALYDMIKQGFTLWTYTNADEQTIEYWTINQYFVSEDEETRKASYDETLVLRDEAVTVEGIDGELVKIATNLDSIDSIWTEQNCVVLMGQHYYYNMTETLGCDEPFFPWFPLYDTKTKQLIGTGLMLFGSTTCTTFENPAKAAVEFIVPTCPSCMLDQVENYGAITLHTYYINQPTIITC